jgi:hypothetical protein
MRSQASRNGDRHRPSAPGGVATKPRRSHPSAPGWCVRNRAWRLRTRQSSSEASLGRLCGSGVQTSQLLTFHGGSRGGSSPAIALVHRSEDDGRYWPPAVEYTALDASSPPEKRYLGRLAPPPWPRRRSRFLGFMPSDDQAINRSYLGRALSGADGYPFAAQTCLEPLCPTTVLPRAGLDPRALDVPHDRRPR